VLRNENVGYKADTEWDLNKNTLFRIFPMTSRNHVRPLLLVGRYAPFVVDICAARTRKTRESLAAAEKNMTEGVLNECWHRKRKDVMRSDLLTRGLFESVAGPGCWPHRR
jgi:hypothetical protein